MSKIALLFPGQGVQYPGMGKESYSRSKAAAEVFEEAGSVLGFDLAKLCFEGSEEELTLTSNAQPAILAAGVAAYRAHIETAGIMPHFMAGHSIGEFTALTCAGALKLADALEIARERGQWMQEAAAPGIGAMAAVSGLEPALVEAAVQESRAAGNTAAVAAYNSPRQTVISGSREAVETLGETFSKNGGRVIPLRVSAPFHSPLMEPAADKLKEKLAGYTFAPPRCPVIANVTGLPHRDPAGIPASLHTQLTQPVMWHQTVDYLLRQRVSLFIDTGPRKRLLNLLKNYPAQFKAFSLDGPSRVEALLQYIGDNAGKFSTLVTRIMVEAVSTPNRRPQGTDDDEALYREGMTIPYRRLKELREKIERERRMPLDHEMKEAVLLLEGIFRFKGLPPGEREERFRRIARESGTVGMFRSEPVVENGGM